jgi:hypothetical protein
VSLLDNASAIEAAAIQMFVDEMAHVRDDPRSRSAARRGWDASTDRVRESWRKAARRVITAAEEGWAPAPNATPPEWRVPPSGVVA